MAFQVNSSFNKVTENLHRDMARLSPDGLEADIILYLGLCNGAGWATTLEGRDIVLLGIEKVMELRWGKEDTLRALIYHEIGHIWHKTYGKSTPVIRSGGEESLIQLYQEGIAMTCEQILCQDDTYYHQDSGDWLSWCRKNEFQIKKEYLNRMENSLSTQDFFGDWCAYKHHSEVGYFLGCEFI